MHIREIGGNASLYFQEVMQTITESDIKGIRVLVKALGYSNLYRIYKEYMTTVLLYVSLTPSERSKKNWKKKTTDDLAILLPYFALVHLHHVSNYGRYFVDYAEYGLHCSKRKMVAAFGEMCFRLVTSQPFPWFWAGKHPLA